MTASGTVKHEYQKQWIYLNPDVMEGPFAWNPANIPPAGDPIVPDTIENIYTIVPMANSVVGQEANLFFDIENCKGREEPDSATRSLANNVALLLDNGNLPPTSRNGLIDIDRITSEIPVMSSQTGANVYLWFDISRLDGIEEPRAAVTTDPIYNGRSITTLTADAPVALEGADGVANVTFDLTTLLDA